MLVVGVDFGTSNMRVAQWDSESGLTPRPLNIGLGEGSTMPAVVAFQRQAGGAVATLVGEDADGLDDGPDTVVVRNIKRWALAGDGYVQWHLESRKTPIPSWWNPQTRCVEVWGEEFPVREVMRLILAEAFQRAKDVGLSGEFEWRAGCPVHAGLEYRSDLAQILAEFGKGDQVSAVIDEPVLFLTLANRLNALEPGSYLVYDLGGGSFDCTLAEVETDGKMTVYASCGEPLRGGATIDELLAEHLGYDGPPSLLRIAKEQLTPTGDAQPVSNYISLSWSDLQAVLRKAMFLDHTLVPMREAYISAKVIWKRDEQESPIASSVPGLRLENMPAAFAKDLDAILLFGGPSKSPFFSDGLAEKFGRAKVVATENLVPAEIPAPELTGISIGACYSAVENHTPLYIRRLPARVTLRESTTGAAVEYEPYQHFARNFNPVRPFVSDPLPPPSNAGARYELVVADPDGKALKSNPVEVRSPADTGPRLVIDTLGQIWVDYAGARRVEIGDTPWQTDQQRAILQAIIDRQRKFQESERERVRILLTDNPFGWQSGHA